MPAGGPYELVLTRGVFYFPAWKHYGRPEISVKCDRCERTDLLTCVGHESTDLCLPCVEIVARWLTGAVGSIPRSPGSGGHPFTTAMLQPMYGSPTVTLMLQPMFRPPATRMMDSMFRR
jgi:hypothetical protein